MGMFHLDSNNGRVFRAATVRVSTIQLPLEIDGKLYETCLFTPGECEVLDRYEYLSEAVAGHHNHCRRMGCRCD